jgi:excinuclease ABC subunit B
VSFQIHRPYEPAGDQPKAIKELTEGLLANKKSQVLLGATGSGKTYTMANVIQNIQKPTLVLSHNKTLAAQLYSEFKEFFPNNAVSYFVSYYDYYQPEAYIPQRDIYIEKDASINEEIDRMRLATTSALTSREDVIVVSSVSCIYGLGSPEDYKEMSILLQVGAEIERNELLEKFIQLQYMRDDIDFSRSKFRVRGDSVELWPSYEEFAYRIEFWGDEIERISIINPTSGIVASTLNDLFLYPAKHFVMPEERIEAAIEDIKAELKDRVKELEGQGKLLEAQRLNARTRYDIEMMLEVGYCSGIENYSQPLSGRPKGSIPGTLIDYFPDDFLMVIDESHVTVPQVRGMYFGDKSRKTTLVEHGFRLPCALENRPLKFDEFEKKIKQVVYVSATPGEYELKESGGEYAEQVIRPTGLVDPEIEIHPSRGQIPFLMDKIQERVKLKERVIVTTLTKRLAEDLSRFFNEEDIACKWLHSELDAFERVEILKDLRLGKFDVVIGVNLLREGIDLPEVSLVAILDADKQGFLRSETSLLQTIGRSARNVNAKVILFADKMTDAMQNAIEETERRRALQIQYNEEHGITPKTISKRIRDGIEADMRVRAEVNQILGQSDEEQMITESYIEELEKEMLKAADELEFERAAALRDRIENMKESIGKPVSSAPEPEKRKRSRGSGNQKRSKIPRPKRSI